MVLSKGASLWLAGGLFLSVLSSSAVANPRCGHLLGGGGASSFTRLQLEKLEGREVPAIYAPTNLTASLYDSSSAVVRWQDNSYDDGVGGVNEDNFVVERYDNVSGWGIVQVTGPDQTQVLDTGLDADTTYYYRVSAYAASDGYSFDSNTDYVTTPPPLPRGPTNLYGAGGSNFVTLNWTDHSAVEDGFHIYRGVAGGSYQYYDYVGANVQTYTDHFVNPASTYFYYVTAYNDAGESDTSNAIQITTSETYPLAASNLSLTADATTVDLHWVDNSNVEQGFRIERSVNGGAFTPLATVGANVERYSDTSAQPDTRYDYRVTAFNSYGDAADVTRASIRTPIQTFTKLSEAKDVYATTTASPDGGILKVFSRADNRLVFSDYAFKGFAGEVRIATGDVTGDGITDVVVAAGPGGGSHVKVFDGANGQLAYSFFAYPNFYGGVFVAVGDVDGDGRADIITGADAGGGPHVKVFSGKDGAEIRSFMAFDTFSGGVRVAAGDTDGDGYADIIVAAGAGGGPHVKVYSGKTGDVLQSFFAYDAGVNVGVWVAAGDLDGDGKADIVTGAGGIAPHVRAFRGTDLTPLASFYAYNPQFAGGVRVAVSAGAEGRGPVIITGAGPGGGPHVRAFNPRTGLPDLAVNFFASDAFDTHGVYVGGVQ